eukprot:TRINITY_DN15058_c0_g2_i8.p2 TRINITY_DN15058_c0_g2~~TRINITY_DN15058_c0_g2_i8.p2  ORF type:complete len:392 (+),score=107.68 TRINITY_DN15058_c0_g2_i8:43-1218(+)
MSNVLRHRTVMTAGEKVAVALPFTDALREYHPEGVFPLLEDPKASRRAAVVGMFVLRPATAPLTGTMRAADTKALFNPALDWVYNLNGVDGGGLISATNPVDAYRLALQYTLSDAVLVGSNIAAVDGVGSPQLGPGYVWQGYAVCEWGNVKAADPGLAAKMMENRKLWQEMGYLSSRKYPAQLVFTQTGRRYEGSNYCLQARIFHDKHPNGERIEAYVLTSEKGAANVRANAAKFGLGDRIDDILVVVPPPAGEEEEGGSFAVDYAAIPQLVHDRLDVKILNHDGGRDLLHAFYTAGALAQMNITLMRHKAVRDVLATYPLVDDATRAAALADFPNRLRYFFSNGEETEPMSHGIPAHFDIACVVTDEADDAAIVTFTCNRKPWYVTPTGT